MRKLARTGDSISGYCCGCANSRMSTSSGEGFALLVCAAVVLILGFFPSEGPGVLLLDNLRVLHWARDSVAFLP